MKSLRLGQNRRLLCASPAYIERHGAPDHPEDLQHHNCLLMRFGTNTDQDWTFVIEGKQLTCRVFGNRIADRGDVIRQWCIDGHGIALKSEWDIRSDLAAGKLVSVLDAYAPEPSALQLVYPAGAVQPRRIRSLLDFLNENLATLAPQPHSA